MDGDDQIVTISVPRSRASFVDIGGSFRLPPSLICFCIQEEDSLTSSCFIAGIRSTFVWYIFREIHTDTLCILSSRNQNNFIAFFCIEGMRTTMTKEALHHSFSFVLSQCFTLTDGMVSCYTTMMIIAAFHGVTNTAKSGVNSDNRSNDSDDMTDFHGMIPFFGNKNKQNNETELSHL